MSKHTILVVISTIALTVLSATSVSAQYNLNLEIFGGVYMPEPDNLDDDVVFGVRLGRTIDERNRFDLSVSFVETAVLDSSGNPVDGVDQQMLHVDIDETLYFNPTGKFRPLVTVGIGWTWVSLSGNSGLTDPSVLDKDSFTVNGGIGLACFFSPTVWLTPEVRARWFEARDHDSTDIEASLVLGFSF